MRKYTTEFLFHLRAIQYVVVQQPDLDAMPEEAWAAGVEPAHIYLICRRPKISLVPEKTRFEDRVVLGAFRVWRGDQYEEVTYRVPNYLGTADVELVADYPGTFFQVVRSDGAVLSSGSAAQLVTMFGRYAKHLSLEVLYVGQSFGFEGSRTAKDRLKSHETLQGIYAEALARSPDMDVWLVLVSFEDPYIITEIDPTTSTLMTDEEDDAHIAQVMETPISLQQQVNLTEAMLIRYFDAPYNVMFRHTFPNPAHKTYDECYALDFHSVGIELETSAISAQLWSGARPASWLHVPSFPLHTDEHRASMFALFDE